jgi:hypothetical protein
MAHAELLYKERCPHAREGYCDEIGDFSVDLGDSVFGHSDDGENDAHARSPGPVSEKCNSVR